MEYLILLICVTVVVVGIIIASKQTHYSIVSLLSLFMFEALVIVGMRSHLSELYLGAMIAMFVFCGLMIVVGWGHLSYPFLPDKKIFTKLMSNAIVPNTLGAFYLLFFVVHLGWLTDGSLNSFRASNDNFLPVSFSIATSLIGIFQLICFFPEGKHDKENAKRAVFVSGISRLSTIKDNDIVCKSGVKLFSLYNVGPLASMFNLCFKSQKIKPENVDKLLILSSETHYGLDFFKNGVIELPTAKVTKEEWETILKGSELLPADAVKNDYKTDKSIYLALPPEPKGSNHSKYVEDCLRTVIRISAICQFPKMKDYFVKLPIDFTSPCDYDDFEQCFEVLNDAIKDEDRDTDLRLYFNLTPGTGIVGSLMTLFSLDKYRELYFYAQNSSKEILPVDKSKVPLENLLSQALDSD